MAQRDSAAVDVQFRRVDRQSAQAGQHLGGKRLVQLDQIDLIQREAGQLQRLVNRRGPDRCRSARARRPRSRTSRSGQRREPVLGRSAADVRTTAAAPSLVCDELPAVTVPRHEKRGEALRAPQATCRAAVQGEPGGGFRGLGRETRGVSEGHKREGYFSLRIYIEQTVHGTVCKATDYFGRQAQGSSDGEQVSQQGAIVPSEVAVGAVLILPGVTPVCGGADDGQWGVSDGRLVGRGIDQDAAIVSSS